MSKEKSTRKLHKAGIHGKHGLTGWDLAVQEAERQVEEASIRLVRLKSALVICIERRDSGAPWPGEKQNEDSSLAA